MFQLLTNFGYIDKIEKVPREIVNPNVQKVPVLLPRHREGGARPVWKEIIFFNQIISYHTNRQKSRNQLKSWVPSVKEKSGQKRGICGEFLFDFNWCSGRWTSSCSVSSFPLTSSSSSSTAASLPLSGTEYSCCDYRLENKNFMLYLFIWSEFCDNLILWFIYNLQNCSVYFKRVMPVRGCPLN